MGSLSTHTEVVHLLPRVLQPIEDAFTCNSSRNAEEFGLVTGDLEKFRRAEVYEHQTNAYFVAAFAAYQQQFRDFISGVRNNPPTLGTCAPNTVAAIEVNMRCMQGQRYDAKQLGLARDEAEASQQPSVLLNFLSTRADALYPSKPQRAPKAQPNSDKVRREIPATEAESSSNSRIQWIVADLARSKTGDARKAAYRFYFGADVSGRSCNRSTAECKCSHDAKFWGKHGLSREVVLGAFSAADKRIAYDGDSRDGQRRGTELFPRYWHRSREKPRRLSAAKHRPGKSRAQQELSTAGRRARQS